MGNRSDENGMAGKPAKVSKNRAYDRNADNRERLTRRAFNCKTGSESWREELNKELSPLQFNDRMKREVLQRAKPQPSFWNREISIPLPVGFLLLLLLLAAPVSVGIHFMQIQVSPGTSAIPLRNHDHEVAMDSAFSSETKEIYGNLFFKRDLTTGWEDAR
ncbi:hypothetical protein [Paenibacillus sp. HB172176]|uniref:hypothetical protein n=1 Tax=Paenibacillus sp. HB172176 TaxID=2493690 RepID=UPI00143B665D|nr:hypothetical protein [Paenibacillus sp. HB172176]